MRIGYRKALKACSLWRQLVSKRMFDTSSTTSLVDRHCLQPLVKNSLLSTNNKQLEAIGYSSDSTFPFLSWYICGPTVYEEAHVGHARTYVTLDIIRRIIEEYCHMPVFVAMGVTDIDDKIIRKAKEEQTTVNNIAEKYLQHFLKDMEALGVRFPHALLKVTDHIPQIINFIQKLVNQRMAYVSKDGSVYFSVSRLPFKYGRLRCLDHIHEEWEQEEPHVNNKEDIRDFVLWKPSHLEEPGWCSPWVSKGRPGWHIECSTMATALFSSNLDIHSGGIDLLFPHHENELAQCSAYFQKDIWCRYWLHTGHVSIAGRKMSKSLKNFITIKEMLSNNDMSAEEFRMFCLLHHYQASVEYGNEEKQEAKQTWKRLIEFDGRCLWFLQHYSTNRSVQSPTAEEIALKQQVEQIKKQITERLLFNFSTPNVIQLLLSITKLVHRLIQEWEGRTKVDMTTWQLIYDTHQYVRNLLNIFGFSFTSEQRPNLEHHLIHLIADFRYQLRTMLMQNKATDQKEVRQKIFQLCDNLRDQQLRNLGIELKDHKDGSYEWRHQPPS